MSQSETPNSARQAQPARALLFGLTEDIQHAIALRLFVRYRTMGRVTYATCEDALSDAILKAQTLNPDVYDLRAWLLTVASHSLLSHERSAAGKSEAPLERTEDEHARLFASVDAHRRAHAFDDIRFPVPVLNILRKESESALREALSKISPSQRKPLWLKHVVGLTYPEIAERLGSTATNVKQQAYNGRLRLKHFLENDPRFELFSILH